MGCIEHNSDDLEWKSLFMRYVKWKQARLILILQECMCNNNKRLTILCCSFLCGRIRGLLENSFLAATRRKLFLSR
jgi:hypothetical protein